jgi:hypothetical protein
MAKGATQSAKYAVEVDGMSRHVFTAQDIHEAEALAGEWGCYHKLRKADVKLSVARDDERPMADEFMAMFRKEAQKVAKRNRKTT